MPRSYRFDHFTANNPEKEAVRAQVKSSVTTVSEGNSRPPPTDKIHYGKKFAQTQELMAAHQMEKQLEELAGIEPETETMKPARPQPIQKEEKRAKTAPIGALPTEAPPEPSGLRDVFDEALHQISRARSAVADLGQVGWRLITLPMRMAKVAAQRFVPRES